MDPKRAVIVVDMVWDNIHTHAHLPVSAAAREIIPDIHRLLGSARERSWPVIFACDSFLEQDFLFTGKMKPHSLRGTPGCQPIEELHENEGDIVLPKRRFSAFFKTDLDQTLRTLGIDQVLVTGITTPYCVLTTALDAVCHDVSAVIVEDCCAAAKPELHEATLSCYRKGPLLPLLQVQTLDEILEEPR